MKELIGLSFEELQNLLVASGEKSFRAKQVWHWLYHRGETDFDRMTTLAKDFREKLKSNYTVSRPQIIKALTSQDKTRKWLVSFEDGQRVEMVYIPEEDRGAVCLSSQVGCAQGCKFCHTGTQKCLRNLTAAEIVGQFMLARDDYHEWPTPSDTNRMLSNIVFMGMGEPLANFDNVAKAIGILTNGDGIGISKRRITVSTCGLAPKIPKLAELGVKLAVSLHAPNDEIRDQIMPINKAYPLKKLIEACKTYQKNLPHRQFITMEYTLLQGINDTPQCAEELMRLVEGLEVKFNLIPFNPWVGCPFKPSSKNAVHRFAKILEDHWFAAPIRASRGQDIMAACGQLKSAVAQTEKK